MVRTGALVAPVVLVVGIFAGEALGPSSAQAWIASAAIGAVAAVLARSPSWRIGLALVALALTGCALERRALDGLAHWPLARASAARADVVARGSLVDDPDGTRWSTRVLLRVDDVRLVDAGRGRAGRAIPVHRTLLVVGEEEAAGRLGVLAAGDRVELAGYLRPLDGYDTRLRWRHVAATLLATRLLDARNPAAPLARLSNVARGVVLRGADALPPVERALVAGFLLGETRDLPDSVVADFRAAGMSHLLAVSGANVAFVLVLAGPVLRRLGRIPRLAVALSLLLVFGAMTRWEPSVLRACVMAAIAVLALHVGRPVDTVRLLGLAVTGLLLVDPFLVHSVGFLLSVGASLGIALLAGPIAARLRGPRWLRDAVATTAAAQVGVAPVLLPVFGSIPLVAVPANLLAVPLAGPLTIWGLAAGVVAGVLHHPAPAVAALLQWPTRVLADAVLGVADAAARVPIAVGPGTVGLGLVLLAGVIAARRRMLRRRAMVLPSR